MFTNRPLSMEIPDAKARVQAAFPGTVCKRQGGHYAVALPDGRRIQGDGSPSGTWALAFETLRLTGVL